MPTKMKALDIETVKCANTLTAKDTKTEIKEHVTYSLVVGLNHSELVTLQVFWITNLHFLVLRSLLAYLDRLHVWVWLPFVFVLGTCHLWNVLPSSCFPESYNLPSFNSKINELNLTSLSSLLFAFFFLPLLGLYIGYQGLSPTQLTKKRIP